MESSSNSSHEIFTMLTTKGARGLLKDVQFPGDSDPTYPIAVSGKKRRRELLLFQGGEEGEVAAALEIQRIWRGYRTRCKLHEILGPWLKGKELSTDLTSRFPFLARQYHDYLQWCVRQGIQLHSTAILTFEDFAARVIQSWWRRIAGEGGCGYKRRALDEQTAATVVQWAWRRYKSVKVYRFYRDLISFRRQGDPTLMLRCINPTEAKLLDKAVGAHVRFRLGGERFPPNIYYKIFTHRPIVDLCACSPRDYTTMDQRRRLARDMHNKQPRLVTGDKESWYKRWENNGWRLVSDRIFLSPLQDPVTIDTASKQQDFHHSKLQRKEDVERRRKHRKIEWLKKMYKEGMLHTRGEMGEPTTSTVGMAADRLVELTDAHGPDTVEEGDVDELLRWTNGLNYEEYVTDWYLSASSAFSDETQCFPSEEDPYGLTLRVTDHS